MSIYISLKFGGVSCHLSLRKWIQKRGAKELWRRWMYDLMFYYILSLEYEHFCFLIIPRRVMFPLQMLV